MKKISCVILIIFLILSFSLLTASKSYDLPEEEIFNYMEYNGNAKMVIDLKDYVLANINMKKILVYDKNKKNSFILSETVFDEVKSNMFFITSFENTIFYTSKDRDTSGSAIYAFNIDTYEKRKLSSYNSIVNQKAFFGLNTLLGLKPAANDSFMVMRDKGDMLIHHNELLTPQDLVEAISKSKNADAYKTPNALEKVSTTKDYIFFLSSFNQLLRYDYKTNETKCLSDMKISDFFIDESYIYFTTVKNSDVLCYASYDMRDTKKIGKINIESIRYKNGTIYLSDEDKNVWYINSEFNLISTGGKIPNSHGWDTDGEYIYACDYASEKVMVGEISLQTGGEKDEQKRSVKGSF